MLLALLLSCAADPGDGSVHSAADVDSGDTAESGQDSGVDTHEETAAPAEPVCGVRPADDWWWIGVCPGMPTPCEIAMDGCTMTITYRSAMTMGMPYGADVAGEKVKFTDEGAKLTGCLGTLDSPDRISGTCESGCTFVLHR